MMPYVAIDLETSGLDPERCSVLELAAVIELDWATPVEALPRFRAVCVLPSFECEPVAAAMNARLIAEIADLSKRGVRGDLDGHLIGLSGFIEKNCPRQGQVGPTIAGKNFAAFDLNFLRKSSQWKLIRHKHRFIDVGNHWWRPQTDACLPDLPTCVKRAGLTPRIAHDATEDCYTVIECVRAAFPQPKKVPL